MTSTHFKTREQSIHLALTDQAAVVTNAGRGLWNVDLEGTGASPVEVRLTNDWVLCCAPMFVAGGDGDFEKYLWTGSLLPGAGKVAFDPGRGVFEVREEIPVIEGIDLADACAQAVAHLTSARGKLAKPARIPRARKKRAAGTAGTKVEFADALREASEAAGWDYVERDDGAPHVTLDLPSGCYQAVSESRTRGDHRIRVSLAPRQSFTDLGRRAVALLLLTANGLVRFARAGIERSASGANAFFETCFSSHPTPALLDAALSALAVSCGLCGREVLAMSDDSVARRYLDARAVFPAVQQTLAQPRALAQSQAVSL